MGFGDFSAFFWRKPQRYMFRSVKAARLMSGFLRRLYHVENFSDAGRPKGHSRDVYVLSGADAQGKKIHDWRYSLLSSPVCNFSSAKDVAQPHSNLVLYSYWQSSCSWRIRFALQLKGLSYDYKPVDLTKGEQFRPEFLALNPLGYVPVLVDDDVVVSDSIAIILHLEEKYRRRSLLPTDPPRRALNFQVAAIISSCIQPLHMLSILKSIEKRISPEETTTWARSNIIKGFQALEKLLKGFAGNLATGEEAYMADVFLGPQIAVATERFDVDISDFPTLCGLYESYKELPEFIASSPRQQMDALC